MDDRPFILLAASGRGAFDPGRGRCFPLRGPHQKKTIPDRFDVEFWVCLKWFNDKIQTHGNSTLLFYPDINDQTGRDTSPGRFSRMISIIPKWLTAAGVIRYKKTCVLIGLFKKFSPSDLHHQVIEGKIALPPSLALTTRIGAVRPAGRR